MPAASSLVDNACFKAFISGADTQERPDVPRIKLRDVMAQIARANSYPGTTQGGQVGLAADVSEWLWPLIIK